MATTCDLSRGVQFDAAAHRFYRPDGRELPGTTRVLKDRGHIDTQWFTEDAQFRGSAFHARTEDFDAGDVAALVAADPLLEGRLAGYARFVGDYRPAYELTEAVVADPVAGYAGIVDRVARLAAVWCACEQCRGPKVVTLDWKTGAPMPWHGLQVAGAYANVTRTPHAAGVYFRPDGTYRVKYYDVAPSRRAFLWEVHQWHQRVQ